MPCVFILWLFPALLMVGGFDLDQEIPGQSVQSSLESHIHRPEGCPARLPPALPHPTPSLGRVTPGRPGTRHSPLGPGQPLGDS